MSICCIFAESTASDQNRPRAAVVTPASVDDEDDDDDEAEMSGSGDGSEKTSAKINDFPSRQSGKAQGVPKVVADNSDDEELVVEEGSGSGDFVEPPPPPPPVTPKGSHRDNGMPKMPIDPVDPPTIPRTVPPKFQLPDISTDFTDTTDDFEIAVASSERPPAKGSSPTVRSSILLLLLLLLVARIRIR